MELQPKNNSSKHKVLIYKPELLPASETFIREQASSYREWAYILVGHSQVRKGLSLNGIDRIFLLGISPSRLQRWLWRMRTWFGLPSQTEIAQLEAQQAQLIQIHFAPNAIDIWPLVKRLKLPMVIMLHGYDITVKASAWHSGFGGFRHRHYPEKLLALAKEKNVFFVAVSEYIRRRALDVGISEDRIYLNPIGVDIRRFIPGTTPYEQRPESILFVGRLVEKKGVSHLISACERLLQAGYAPELIIIGDGPLRESLKAQCRRGGIKARFEGVQPPEVIQQALQRSRMLCLPSVVAENGDAEGLGMVLLEAQASGTPVITSSIGAKDFALLDGKTGFYFSEGDEEALEDAIKMVLEDLDRATIMSHAARKFAVDRFDLFKCTERLEKTYDDILSRLE